MTDAEKSAAMQTEVVNTLPVNTNAVAVADDPDKKKFSIPTIPGFKVSKLVTIPQLSIKYTGNSCAIKITSAIAESKVPPKNGEQPASVIHCVNLEDGQICVFIVPAVVMFNLTRDYPNDSYVGKSFFIKNLGRRKEGQRYGDYGIVELEPITDDGVEY
jgi:hypothetical protein